MLVGRDAEQRALGALLQSARDGRSAVLVVRGDAGVGKTALLRWAADEAGDMTVLRCRGVEAEHELPFAALHQLVRPGLGLVERLPAPQAGALRSALGLSFGGVRDRFLVSLGFLSLLAEIAERRPTLCCVDDAQWLDGPSAEALVFAARRFDAEPLALLITVRAGEAQEFRAPGLPELELRGLHEEDARALLAERLDRPASPDVLATVLRTARGNPLALLELPLALTDAQLEGVEPILGPPPVGRAVEAEFRSRIATLGEPSRLALLVAAADEAGDVPTVRRATERLGLSETDLDPAERVGLVRVDGEVVFRHPLVRSAIYRSATYGERRAAHEALAAVLHDPGRRAWHRALVAERADESLAVELDAVAARAAERGAHSSAASAYKRAAEFSDERARKAHRLRLAAEAALEGGRPDAALGLVERARPVAVEPGETMALDVVAATVETARCAIPHAYAHLLRAASASAPLDPGRVPMLLMGVAFVADLGGWPERGIAEARDVLAQVEAEEDPHRMVRAFLDGAGALLEGELFVARRRLTDAVDLGERRGGDVMLPLAALAAVYVGDIARAREICARGVAARRSASAFAQLAGALPILVSLEVVEHRIADADTSRAEGAELSEHLGYDNHRALYSAMEARIAAVRGREAECRERAAAAVRGGLAPATAHARIALAELALTGGRTRLALERFDELDSGPLPPLALMATADVVDAAVRADDPVRARAAVERLAAWAPVSPAPFVHGLLARCRAVLGEGTEDVEPLFVDALAPAMPPYERARTELAYGEWLRRERRRVDARPHLRRAVDTFEELGAVPWTERARGELRATGETARRREPSTIDDLTAQERRIARLVAAGASNRDVAAQLFLSPKTIDYHLRKVFLKLGIASRVELARLSLD